MDSLEILGIILLLVALGINTFCEFWKSTNELPRGKRAVKKFTEKLNTIFDVTKDGKSIKVTHNGKVFDVKVLAEDKQNGLEYSTIPRYISKMLYINDEPVCRVHDLEGYLKHYIYLEFARSRKQTEIIELAEATYTVAMAEYKAQLAALYMEDKKSFY